MLNRCRCRSAASKRSQSGRGPTREAIPRPILTRPSAARLATPPQSRWCAVATGVAPGFTMSSTQVGRAHDVVAVEHLARLPTHELHGDPLRDSRTDGLANRVYEASGVAE